MGIAGDVDGRIAGDSESARLLLTSTDSNLDCNSKIPNDSFHLAYIVYFTLGAGYLLPWNAFITAVDYFSYLYPDAPVDRIFAVAYMVLGLICLLILVAFSHKSDSFVRVNVGLALFVVSLLIVPVMDLVYIKGRVGLYDGFYVSVAAIALSGIADALVQSGVIGAAGELPARYMQATVAGTAASGVLVAFLRVFTKAVYPQNPEGLRQSANLYFLVSIVVMVICIIFYNLAHRLPIIKYYNDLKKQALLEEKAKMSSTVWRSTLWDIVGTVKWYGSATSILYIVTLAIYPGYITEDVHSEALKDWYPLILITCFNVFDLVGKSLTSLYMLENQKVAIAASFARLIFFPLFLASLHGPKLFRTEIPVTLLTCLLGLTNGYLTSVLLILAPKTVQLQHSETAGVVMVLFLVIGLASGSILSWFWVV
ncbi:equilibrative nucleotide transporter 1 [Impatiens glandulifera]|uniref:equilibrative nucleotide transporter 1 n=1 Tax=Impatiens glandulifera TaxID=253017 RepID=UPI001FB15172|nr:equilibrative nucleotide transporter 1 [Impatiens glandulifera]